MPKPVPDAVAIRSMRLVDEATKKVLEAMGLEAFRFDVDNCPEEAWLRLKIKIRSITKEV